MTDIKLLQKQIAGIANELLQLEQDSEAMLAAPDDAADLAILKLQCKIVLKRTDALQTKISVLQNSMEAEGTEVPKATKVMLKQYQAILTAKYASTTKYLATLSVAAKVAQTNRK